MTGPFNLDDSPDEPTKRKYYRHRQTGDKAYLVMVDGQQHIKFDRPFDNATMLFQDGEWTEDTHPEPLARAHASRVAFDADKALCSQLGLHQESKRDWRALSHISRGEFIANGPKGPEPRKELYRAIMKVLEPYTRPE